MCILNGKWQAKEPHKKFVLEISGGSSLSKQEDDKEKNISMYKKK